MFPSARWSLALCRPVTTLQLKANFNPANAYAGSGIGSILPSKKT